MSVTTSEDRAAIDAEHARLAEGQSIEDLAGQQEDEEGQQFIDFGDHVNLAIKGSKPTDSEIKIKAISRPIKGQLGDAGDDESVALLVTVRLDEIRVVAKRDGDGRITSKIRRHVFTPMSVYKVDKDQADVFLGLGE